MNKKIAYTFLILCLGLCLSTNVFAKTTQHKKTPEQAPEISRELDLSIPINLEEDISFEETDEKPNAFKHKHKSKSEEHQIINAKNKKRAVDVDCGMDVNPYAQSDSSISNRLTGECDFKYRY